MRGYLDFKPIRRLDKGEPLPFVVTPVRPVEEKKRFEVDQLSALGRRSKPVAKKSQSAIFVLGPFISRLILAMAIVGVSGYIFGLKGEAVVSKVQLKTADAIETALSAKDSLLKGFDQLQALRPDLAEPYFRESLEASSRLDKLLLHEGQRQDFLTLLSVRGSAVLSAEEFVELAERSAKLGQQTAEVLKKLASVSKTPIKKDPADQFGPINERLGLLTLELRPLAAELGALRRELFELERLTDSLARKFPEDRELADLKKKILAAKKLSGQVSDGLVALPKSLGFFGRKKFLVMFQNNAELRPSGGFLGSFGLIELEKGKVKNLKVEKNIYTLDKAFARRERIEPPWQLKKSLKIGRLTLRDSNFDINFPDAAKRVIWFYERESGEAVDGLIAIDTTTITELIKLTRPIELPDYQTVITDENFVTELAYKIEREYFFKEENKVINQPKTILEDMLPAVIERLTELETKDADGFKKFLTEQVRTKHILAYHPDQAIFNLLDLFQLSGRLRGEDQPTRAGEADYLYLSNANLNGKKSSLNIDQSISLMATVDPSGRIKNSLSIRRRHLGTGQWPDGTNNNYLRVASPLGSKLISSSLQGERYDRAIETTEEAGMTIFGGFVNTPPGQELELKIDYLLPERFNLLRRGTAVERLKDRVFSTAEQGRKSYQILVDQQPGSRPSDLAISFVLPEGWSIEPKSLTAKLDSDQIFDFQIAVP